MPLDPGIFQHQQPAPSTLGMLSDALDVRQKVVQGQQQQLALQSQKALDDSMKAALNPDGSFNQDAVTTHLISQGFGHLVPAIRKQMTEADTAAATLSKTQNEIAGQQNDLKGALANGVKEAGYNVGVFTAAMGHAVSQKLMTPQQAQQAIAMGMQNPEAIKPLVDNWIDNSPKQKELGSARITAEAHKTTADIAAKEAPAKLAVLQADAAIKGQVAAGTQGGITPEQQARLKLEAQQRAIAAGQLGVAQAREKREGAQSDVAPQLSPAGMDVAAENYATTGQLPPMGMGKQGAAVRTAIINRAAELHPGMDLASNRAGFQSDEGSLKKLQAQRDAISSFEKTASKNIDIFLNTAGKVVDTGSPMANSLARAVSGKMLGSSDQAAYDAARQVAINEIAKITSNPNLSGSLSDSARHEVDAFNPNSATLKQTVAVMRILKQDMSNRASAMDDTLATIKGRIGGKGAAATMRFNPATGKLEPVK